MCTGPICESGWSDSWLHNNNSHQYGVSYKTNPYYLSYMKEKTKRKHLHIELYISHIRSSSFDAIRAVKRSNCFHRNGHNAACDESNTINMIIFAAIQILLSQLPNFHKLWWLSIVAAVMSVTYSSIGLGLSIAKIAGSPYKPKINCDQTYKLISENLTCMLKIVGI